MVCGAFLGLPANAHAQSVQIAIDDTTQPGPPRQSLLQVIHVTNQGTGIATNVTVTFTAPKGAKVDSACQLDRFHGVRSYTCFVGTITGGATVDIPFSIALNKSDEVGVEVICDQGTFIGSLSITIL